jgi:hypothetical protein
MKFRFRALHWLALVIVVGVIGCNRRDTVQVSGKVLYKDGSVPNGGVREVQFLPADDSTAKVRKGATGNIGEDGTFVAFTRKPGDGVFRGKYDVVFNIWKSAMQPQSLIDAKYCRPSTTPYHITIDSYVDDLKFEIEPLKTKK